MGNQKERERQFLHDRDGGLCQYRYPDGHLCLAPAAEVHHINPKRMGGRKGKAKAESERPENKGCRCWLHNHAKEIDGKWYMGHTE